MNNMSLKKQYPGLYLLKSAAMFLVVILHLTGIGGAAYSPDASRSTVILLSSFQFISYSCINLFAMATGFIYYGRGRKLSKLLSLWFQVFFYSVMECIIFFLITRDLMSVKPYILGMIFPFSFKHYWYFSFYCVVFVFIPFLNTAVEKMSKGYLAGLIAFLLLVSNIGMITNNDLLMIDNGYSPLWLIILYLIGACVKKYDLHEKRIPPVFVILSIGMMIASVLIAFVFGNGDLPFNMSLFNYINLPIVCFSVLLFLLFFRIGKGKQCPKALKMISASSFTVYLIHTHHIVFNNVIKGRFAWIGAKGVFPALIYILLCALCIYIICTVLGLLQIYLFKLIKVDDISQKIADKVKKIIKKSVKI